ncbi:BRICHOS domain-containing protein 5 isoform X2 [Oxyura jamaicensis]|uniref:BRICHOS domain-containing protein 5 isoform X2 n=1 Tax=Oxyura jamaicensis TaxID=8884 RepID=UPI0015A675FD|nr:BRICHOS domain-containing protein 5 isoform X2 [Oxyura jamaicensis]
MLHLRASGGSPAACLSFSGTFGAQDHAQSACGPEAELQERGPHLKRGWRTGTAPAARAPRRLAAQFPGPPRTFWIILSVALFFAVVGISIGGILGFSPSPAQGEQDSPRNQTALVDASRSTVTYYVTSRSNRSAVVLYDSHKGYVCYRPAEQRACYLRRMDPGDRESTRVMLSASELRGDPLLQQNNQTKYYREFLGILAGEQVDPSGLGEAIQALCEQTPIFWVRRAQGPGKQRLIYLCIDICFPSNICVSICFYYLPE